MLTFMLPMLPALADTPPEGDEWQHEIKFDGHRTQLAVEGDTRRSSGPRLSCHASPRSSIAK